MKGFWKLWVSEIHEPAKQMSKPEVSHSLVHDPPTIPLFNQVAVAYVRHKSLSESKCTAVTTNRMMGKFLWKTRRMSFQQKGA